MTNTCAICDSPDNDKMVQCDKCDKWHHHNCVGTIEEQVRDISWICPSCAKPKSKSGKSSTSRSSKLDEETLKTIRELEDSELRIEASKAAQEKARIEMEAQAAQAMAIMKAKIAEEQAQIIQEQLKIKYANQRLTIIRDNNSINSVSNTSSVKRTIEWVEQHQQPAKQPELVKDTQRCDKNINLPTTNKIIHSTPYRPTGTNHPIMTNINKNTHLQFNQVKGGDNVVQIKNYAMQQQPSEVNYDQLTRAQVRARQGIERIELPVFDGDPCDWPSFITTYQLSTERCGYDNVENMVRLKKVLKGRALQAVKGNLLFPEQVPIAIERLTNLFGRPKHVIGELMGNVQKLQRIYEDDMNGILEMSFQVDNLCAVIQATKAHEYYVNAELLQILIEKLPGHLRISWSTYEETKEEPGLLAFRNWLHEMSTKAERVLTSSAYFKSSKGDKINKNEKVKRSSASKYNVYHHESQESQNKIKYTDGKVMCCVCEKTNHSISECNQFKKLDKKNKWNTVLAKGLCGRCLEIHNWKTCRNVRECGIEGCKRKHHPLLHAPNREGTLREANEPARVNQHTDVGNECNSTISENMVVLHESTQHNYYRVIPVTIYGRNKSAMVYAFLDEGSSITMMENAMADLLDLTGPKSDLCLKWTGTVSRVEKDSRCVSLMISDVKENSTKYNLRRVRTVDNLNLPVQSIHLTINDENNSHLQGIPLPTYINAKPSILIGTDNSQIIVPREVRSRGWDEPMAVRCNIGWTLYGNSINHETANINVHSCKCDGTDTLQELMKNYFSLDSFGVVPNTKMQSDEDKRALDILNNTTTFENNRYTTGLLWRRTTFTFPESRNGALRRLECFENKLLKDEKLRLFASERIKDYINKGYVRKLENTELVTCPKTWYLPIFIVTNPNKQKHRIVWDAAYMSNGVSLNSELLTGPDELTSLIFVLYNFRTKKYGVTADIREMFHRIKVKKSDQDAQRFL